jgi:hypothetical protein
MMLPFGFWNPTGDLACPSQLEATSGKESESESARRARALEQAAGVAPGAGAGTFALEDWGRPHWRAYQPQWPESLPIMIPLEPATSESVRGLRPLQWPGHCGPSRSLPASGVQTGRHSESEPPRSGVTVPPPRGGWIVGRGQDLTEPPRLGQ